MYMYLYEFSKGAGSNADKYLLMREGGEISKTFTGKIYCVPAIVTSFETVP